MAQHCQPEQPESNKSCAPRVHIHQMGILRTGAQRPSMSVSLQIYYELMQTSPSWRSKNIFRRPPLSQTGGLPSHGPKPGLVACFEAVNGKARPKCHNSRGKEPAIQAFFGRMLDFILKNGEEGELIPLRTGKGWQSVGDRSLRNSKGSGLGTFTTASMDHHPFRLFLRT